MVRLPDRLILARIRGGKRTALAATAFLLTLRGLLAPVLAQESVLEDQPPPSSVEESVTPMDRTFETPPERVRLIDVLKQELKDLPAFFRDTKLDVNLRTFYLYRDKFDNSKSEAWALGGFVTYKSGYFLDHFAVGVTPYTSAPLYAPKRRDGTGLLEPGQDSYAVFGQLYGEIKLVDDVLVDVFRKEYSTPYINKNDSRMTPNTFEGYTLVGKYGGKGGAPEFRYGGGYITKIKERNSDDFVWMSRAAGARVKRGVAVAGGNYKQKNFSLGVIDYYATDIINIVYTEGKYARTLKGGLGLLGAAQFSHQESTGDNLLTGRTFSTHQLGVKGEASYAGALLSLAYTNTASGANMQSPWSSYPGYTKVQVQDFNRAGEEAVLLRVSYDFTRVGLEGVTVFALWVHGWDAVDPATKAPAKDQDEYDVDFQWRPKSSLLNGVWFRVRYAYVDQRATSASINDLQLIVHYDFSLL